MSGSMRQHVGACRGAIERVEFICRFKVGWEPDLHEIEFAGLDIGVLTINPPQPPFGHLLPKEEKDAMSNVYASTNHPFRQFKFGRVLTLSLISPTLAYLSIAL